MVGRATGREIMVAVALRAQGKLVVVTAWLASDGDLVNEGEGEA